MCRAAIVVMLFMPGWSIVIPAQFPQARLKPKLPHYDWNVCPGEGCVYREWSARKIVSVYNTYKPERRQFAQLEPGEKVYAHTGVVITFRPGVIRVDKNAADGLQYGDHILTYADLGEGNSVVWFKEHYFASFDVSFVRRPDGSGCHGSSCKATYIDLGKKTWWAEVELASGANGWIDMDTSDMTGVCAIAIH